MNPATIALVLNILESLPQLIQAGVDVTNVLQNVADTIKLAQSENRDPTDAEWAALDASVQTLRDQVDNKVEAAS